MTFNVAFVLRSATSFLEFPLYIIRSYAIIAWGNIHISVLYLFLFTSAMSHIDYFGEQSSTAQKRRRQTQPTSSHGEDDDPRSRASEHDEVYFFYHISCSMIKLNGSLAALCHIPLRRSWSTVLSRSRW